jgi:hypothetical protein
MPGPPCPEQAIISVAATRWRDGDPVREGLDEQRDRYHSGVMQRALWTSLVTVVLLGALSGLVYALAWSRYLVLCAVGLMAGIAVAVAVTGSARGREQAALVLGAVTLPILAALVAGVAALRGVALDAYGEALVPFLVHASGALLGGILVARVWKGLPSPPPAEGEEEGTHDTVAGPPPVPERRAGAPGGSG